jgi:hypothetical protein
VTVPAVPTTPSAPKPNQYSCTTRIVDKKTGQEYRTEKEVGLDPKLNSGKPVALIKSGSFKVTVSMAKDEDILISSYNDRELVHQVSSSVGSQYVSSNYSPKGEFQIYTFCSKEGTRSDDAQTYPHVDTSDTPMECSVKIIAEGSGRESSSKNVNTRTHLPLPKDKNLMSQIAIPMTVKGEDILVVVGKTKTHFLIWVKENERGNDEISRVRTSHDSSSMSAYLETPKTGSKVKVACIKN